MEKSWKKGKRLKKENAKIEDQSFKVSTVVKNYGHLNQKDGSNRFQE